MINFFKDLQNKIPHFSSKKVDKKETLIYLQLLVVANRCSSIIHVEMTETIESSNNLKLAFDDLKNVLRDATRYFYCAELLSKEIVKENSVINWQQANNVLLTFKLHLIADKQQIEALIQATTRNNLILELEKSCSTTYSIHLIETSNYTADPEKLFNYAFKRV